MRKLAILIFVVLSGFLGNENTILAEEDKGLPHLPSPEGFGYRTTGGQEGKIYRVTNLNDSGPGSLREGAEMKGPVYLKFNISGPIKLESPVKVASDKTIDGRGEKIIITKHGFQLSNVNNIIIANLIFKDGQGDGIQVLNRSQNIWIDHCTLSNYEDGLIDITQRASYVTISWSKFENHERTMLIGNRLDDPKNGNALWVTMHHNFFNETEYRHPRLSFGKVHAYNNFFYHWKVFAMGSSNGAQLISEANIFEPRKKKDKAILSHLGKDPKGGSVVSIGDLTLRPVLMDLNKREEVFDPQEYYEVKPEKANLDLLKRIKSGAGWQRF